MLISVTIKVHDSFRPEVFKLRLMLSLSMGSSFFKYIMYSSFVALAQIKRSSSHMVAIIFHLLTLAYAGGGRILHELTTSGVILRVVTQHPRLRLFERGSNERTLG